MTASFSFCRNIRLDGDARQTMEVPSSPTNDAFVRLSTTIENEFAHLSMNTYSYELKPINEKVPPTPSMMKTKDSMVNDYELTCRLIEVNMPIVPPLKMKLTIQYPNEPPEILSLTSTATNVTPTKLENSGTLTRSSHPSTLLSRFRWQYIFRINLPKFCIFSF